MNIKKMNVVADIVNGCADSLIRGFFWDKSEQGEDYWNEVHDNLLAIVREYEEKEENQEPEYILINGVQYRKV